MRPSKTDPGSLLGFAGMAGSSMFEGFVVFLDDLPGEPSYRGQPRWWRLFTRKGFRHCVVVTPIIIGDLIDDPLWLSIDSLACWMDVRVTVFPPDVPDDAMVLWFRSWRPRRYIGRGFITCVSVAKAVLGVRAWWVVTPYQLYLHMRRLGASGIESYTKTNRSRPGRPA